MKTHKFQNRREFLASSSMGAAALGLLPGLMIREAGPSFNSGRFVSGKENNQYTLFYQPSLIRDPSLRYSAWSNSIAVQGNRLVNAVGVQLFEEDNSRKEPLGLAIAVSEDGVHWEEIHPFVAPVPGGHAGYCLRWTGREFIYYSTEQNSGADRDEFPVIMRQYSSPDLENWEYMGDEFTTRPEKEWYRVRWDELVILEDEDAFFGYITSECHPGFATDSLGMLKSPDGIKWEVIPPPVIEWEDLPPQHMEVCLCEKIGGRYYLGMGGRCYMGHLGFSLFTFVGDSPTGPFRPDREAFRLCGTTTRDTNWLAKTFHWNGEILLSNWITTSLDKSFPGIFGNGKSLWVGPLKKLKVDTGGHLRIAWWDGNEQARSDLIPADLIGAEHIHPAPGHRGSFSALKVRGPDEIHLSGGRDGSIALLPVKFDLKTGLIMEGVLKAYETRGHVGTHWHPAAAGFYLEETPGRGLLIQMETLGLTRIGIFEYSATSAFKADEYRVAAYGNINRGGSYLGLSRFIQEDVVGPQGFATPCGIKSGTTHYFRLLVKEGMFELYLDDLLVQTYITGDASGRMGLFARSGPVEFRGIQIWQIG